MKVSILGGGSAACITALKFNYLSSLSDINLDIEIIHDPSVPAEEVGQGTSLQFGSTIWNSLSSNDYFKDFSYTLKRGILYKNWGKKENEFFHDFPTDSCAIHFRTKDFQSFILNSNLFIVKEDNIIDLKTIESDVIIDCRGNNNKDENYKPLLNPLNCAFIGYSESDTSGVNWTTAETHPNGWSFKIPNEDHTFSHGYLYNSTITSEEDAKTDCKKRFDFNITKKINFSNYISTQPINKNIALNGNRLFFCEPLEATSLGVYDYWAGLLFNVFIDKTLDSSAAISYLNTYCTHIEEFILWHYETKSPFDSKFWNFASSNIFSARSRKFNQFFDAAKNSTLVECKNSFLPNYAQWTVYSFKNWIEATS